MSHFGPPESSVQKIDYPQPRERLLADNQILQSDFVVAASRR